MSMTFYYSPNSSASPVHWTLEELGVPYEKVQLDLKSGEQKKPEFRKLNPNCKVPLLVHDGVPIFESAAIQLYLGETFGVQKGLYPAPGPQRGEVMKWIIWTNTTLGDVLARIGRNLAEWAPADERNAKAGTSAKTEGVELLKIVEEALGDREYLVGNKFSLADLHLASWMQYAGMMGLDLSSFPKLQAWTKRCNERPAAQNAS